MSEQGLNVERLREALVEAGVRTADGRWPHQLTDREVVALSKALLSGLRQLATAFRTLAKPMAEGMAALVAALEGSEALRAAVLGERAEGAPQDG